MQNDILNEIICPKTGKSLVFISEELLLKLNHKIKERSLKNESGEKIELFLEQALCIQENPEVVYPVRDGIPVLIQEEAISLEQLNEV